MTLQFAREIIYIDGVPVVGTIEVEVEGELNRCHGLFHGSWLLDLEVLAFLPEDGGKGLLWENVEGPCETWLAANKIRVERLALENAAP